MCLILLSAFHAKIRVNYELIENIIVVSVYNEKIPDSYTSCKVEFIQPSNWLYSVPNLLVIQHLVTLYLGGFDVRVVSEIE